MRGRKPIPPQLTIIRGNPGKRPPRPTLPVTPALPEAPAHLSPAARAEWDRICAELHALGILSALDRAVLALYATAWARWSDAETRVNELGAIVASVGKSKRPIANPYLAVAHAAMVIILRMASEFGLTPAARVRLAAGSGAPRADSDTSETFFRARRRPPA